MNLGKTDELIYVINLKLAKNAEPHHCEQPKHVPTFLNGVPVYDVISVMSELCNC